MRKPSPPHFPLRPLAFTSLLVIALAFLVKTLRRLVRQPAGREDPRSPVPISQNDLAGELNTLLALAEILNQTLPPEHALGAGLEMVARHTGASAGWILTLTPDGRSSLAAGYRLPPDMELAGDPNQTWELCACLRESQSGRLQNPIRIYNCERLKAAASLPQTQKHHMSIPIRAGGRPVGILNLVIPAGRHISPAGLSLVAALGDQFGGAVERARLFKEVQKLAVTDSLTGLYNRRYFADAAARELERSRRYRRPITIALLDIDRFKQINDTFGHLAGDQVLAGVALICQKELRKVDVITRYGGEEFVILMPETGQKPAFEALERLRRRVELQDFPLAHGSVAVTVSIGMVNQDENTPVNPNELIARADAALYQAKNGGRNQVRIWQP